MRSKRKKIVTATIAASCSLVLIAGLSGLARIGGLTDADINKGLRFNLQGLLLYGLTRKAKFIPSGASQNPVYPTKEMEGLDYSVKDACIVEKDGRFYLFASAFYEDNGRMFPHIIGAAGDTLSNISPPFFSWSGSESGFLGLASPDVARYGDIYYMVYNSWGDKEGEPNQLFYAKSLDLIHWDTQNPLAKNLTSGIRSIDASVMFYNEKVYLVYKENQKMKFAAADSIDGTFTPIENNVYGWYENYQFLLYQDDIYMVGTNRRHLPILLKIQGDPNIDSSWGNFKPVLALTPPKQDFNTKIIANAASVFVYSGEYYLLYAGITEGSSHIGRGNNKLGLAKSGDLLNWTVL